MLVQISDNITHEDIVKALREIENTPGVDFVDTVTGRYDLVVMVEAPANSEAITGKIRAKSWVKDIETMRVVNMFEGYGTKKAIGKKTLSYD